MAELLAIEPANPWTGGPTDQVFTTMAASTTVRITGRELFLFKADDDLGCTIVITSVAAQKTSRTGDVTIVVATGAGNYGLWKSSVDGFKNPSTAFVTVPIVANGEMMVVRMPQ